MRLLCSLFLSLLVCTIYAQEEGASISGREKWVYITSILFPWLEDARSSLYCKEVIFFFARGSHKFEIKIKKEWDIIFARGSHKCPQDPSFSCNDDQTCCKLPKGEVPVFVHLCSLYPEVFFTKLFFVLLLSTRIIIFIKLFLQGVGCCPYKDATCCKDQTHCCPHGGAKILTFWNIDLIRLLHWEVVWIFDSSCQQDFMKAFNDTCQRLLTPTS